MTVATHLVVISSSADELLRELADQERLDPAVLANLYLEMAIRERHELQRQFRAAAAEVLRNGR